MSEAVLTKPNGIVCFKNVVSGKCIAIVRVNSPYETSRIFEQFVPAKTDIDVFNCDSDKCRFIFDALIEILEKEQRARFNDVVKNIPEDEEVLTMTMTYCTLDRECLHLLAKLDFLHVNVWLGYGTKIISFKDVDDLVACLTELNVKHVWQDEDTLDFASFGWIEDTTACQESSQQSTTEKRLARICIKVTRVNLVFGVKFKDRFLTNKADFCSKQFEFEILNCQLCGFLSPLAIVSLRAPSLESLTITSMDIEAISEILPEIVRTNRPAFGNPFSLDMMMDGVPFCAISDALLDVFNEKKMTNLTIYLEDEIQVRLLPKVLTVIAKSIYIESLSLHCLHSDNCILLCNLDEFLHGLIALGPTLVRPLRVSTFFADRYRIVDNNQQYEKVQCKLKWIEKIMERMKNKDLLIIEAFVGTLILERFHRSSVRMLHVDLLHCLKEMLVAN